MFFQITWLVVPWVYPTEIFPLAIRAKGNAFGIIGTLSEAGDFGEVTETDIVAGWSLGCGSVSLAAPSIFGALGPNGFYIHAVFNLVAVAIVYCFYPETARRTLEEASTFLPYQAGHLLTLFTTDRSSFR